MTTTVSNAATVLALLQLLAAESAFTMGQSELCPSLLLSFSHNEADFFMGQFSEQWLLFFLFLESDYIDTLGENKVGPDV